MVWAALQVSTYKCCIDSDQIIKRLDTFPFDKSHLVMKPKPLSGLSSIFFRDLSTIFSETYRMKKATKSVLYYIAVLAGLILVLVVARTIYRKHKLASRIVQSKESYDTKTVEHVQHVEAFVENVIQKQPLKHMSTPKLLRVAKWHILVFRASG